MISKYQALRSHSFRGFGCSFVFSFSCLVFFRGLACVCIRTGRPVLIVRTVNWKHCRFGFTVCQNIAFQPWIGVYSVHSLGEAVESPTIRDAWLSTVPNIWRLGPSFMTTWDQAYQSRELKYPVSIGSSSVDESQQ